MDPTWDELKEPLLDALTSAFSEGNFRVMLRTKCDKDYNRIIVPTHTYPQRVLDVIEDAQRDGWLLCLAEGACKENPGNDPLQEVTTAILAGIEVEGRGFYQTAVDVQPDTANEMGVETRQVGDDEPGVSEDAGSNTGTSGKPLPSILAFIIINAILFLLSFILASWIKRLVPAIPLCAPDPISTLGLTLIVFLTIHLLWRVYSRRIYANGVKFNVPGGFVLPYPVLKELVNSAHPFIFPDRPFYVVILALIVLTAALGLTPWSPTNQEPDVPQITHYSISKARAVPVGDSLQFGPSQREVLGIIPGNLLGIKCEWKSDDATVVEPHKCATEYIAPHEPGIHFIELEVSSICNSNRVTNSSVVYIP